MEGHELRIANLTEFINRRGGDIEITDAFYDRCNLIYSQIIDDIYRHEESCESYFRNIEVCINRKLDEIFRYESNPSYGFERGVVGREVLQALLSRSNARRPAQRQQLRHLMLKIDEIDSEIQDIVAQYERISEQLQELFNYSMEAISILLDQRQVVRESLKADLLRLSINISHSVGDIEAEHSVVDVDSE